MDTIEVMPCQSWISTLASMDATQSFGLSFKPIVHGGKARMQDQMRIRLSDDGPNMAISL